MRLDVKSPIKKRKIVRPIYYNIIIITFMIPCHFYTPPNSGIIIIVYKACRILK